MEWIEKVTDGYEIFWHITTKDKVGSIKEKGLLQQDELGLNANGLGIYCIERNKDDLTQLNTLTQFMEQSDIPKDEQMIVEFEYMGDYLINQTDKIYREEGWIIIQNNIPAEHIEKILPMQEL